MTRLAKFLLLLVAVGWTVPAFSQASAPRPLILWLHGCTQSAQEFMGLTGLAEKQQWMGLDAIIYTPEQSVLKNPLTCWNWFLPANQKRNQGKLKEITDHIQQLVKKGLVDPEQIYVGWFSAGGVLAAHFAYCYPDTFKAALIHSGAPYRVLGPYRQDENDLGEKAIKCSRDISRRKLQEIVIVRGERDKISTSSHAQKSLRQGLYFLNHSDDGPLNSSFTKVADSEDFIRWKTSGGAVVSYIRVPGMGHAWSGGAAGYTFASPNTFDVTILFLSMIKSRSP